MNEQKLLKNLLPLFTFYPWSIPAFFILGLLSSLSEGIGITLLIPFLQSFGNQATPSETSNFLIRLLDKFFTAFPPSQRLIYIPLIILGCIILKNCFYYLNLALLSWLNSRVSHRLRCEVFSQLLKVSYRFLDRQEAGKILNTMTAETWRTNDALVLLVKSSVSLSIAIVYVILLFLISWQLTLLVIFIMGLISLLTRWITRKSSYLSYQAVEANSVLGTRMYEGFTGLKTIRAFTQENYEQKRFNEASRKVRDCFFQLDLLANTVNPLYEVFSAFVVIGVLIFVLIYERNALPSLLTFIFILYRLQPQIQLLDSSRVSLLTLGSSVKDVMTFLDKTDKPYIESGTIPFEKLELGITFKSVSFWYDPQTEPALSDISLHIPRGKTTAFVGKSGAGKSTLINLICRFYEVSQGEILIDQLPLKQLDLIAWRNRIAIVSQDIHIFSTTIRENIAYGRLDATGTEIMAAAKQAHAHDFINQLPMRYDTKVGDRGVRLSGGQRQRIALARAILRNPDILILDEATNALDNISEQLIQQALELIGRNRTVIMIAHRLSTVQKADQILVLDRGRIVEKGNLTQLLELNSLFAQLYCLELKQATHLGDFPERLYRI